MIRIACISQWVCVLAIFVIAFRHSYRAGRITRFAVCFTWISLVVISLVYVIYANTLEQSEREQWANSFFEGTHFLAFALMGWMEGLIISVLAVGVRRVIRKEPLFQVKSG